MHTDGEAKSGQSAVYDCLVPYVVRRYKHENHSKSLDMVQILIIRLHRSWFRGTAVERRLRPPNFPCPARDGETCR